MKKLVLALLMVAMLAGGAFAQASLSAGFGGTFTTAFQNYSLTDAGKDIFKALVGYEDPLSQNITGGGAFAFFDATYVMASLGINFYSITYPDKDLQKAMDNMKTKDSMTTFDIELFGKFPIDLGGFTLFPILGVGIKLVLAQDADVNGTKYAYEDYHSGNKPLDRLTNIWGKLGVGADIPLGDTMYLRPIILYGGGSYNKAQQDALDVDPYKLVLQSILNHGLDIKLALGFKF